MTRRSPGAWLLVLALVFCQLAGSGRPGLADEADGDLERARELFYQGKKLFSLRRFEDALAKFEAAYEAKPIPDFLFNVGQCHRNLGRYEEAIFSFRRYLNLKPDSERRAQIEELIEELEEKARKAREDRRKVPLVPGEPKKPPESSPIYTRWWFWGGIAAVAAGTTAIVITQSGGSGLPETDLGNLDFGR